MISEETYSDLTQHQTYFEVGYVQSYSSFSAGLMSGQADAVFEIDIELYFDQPSLHADMITFLGEQ